MYFAGCAAQSAGLGLHARRIAGRNIRRSRRHHRPRPEPGRQLGHPAVLLSRLAARRSRHSGAEPVQADLLGGHRARRRRHQLHADRCDHAAAILCRRSRALVARVLDVWRPRQHELAVPARHGAGGAAADRLLLSAPLGLQRPALRRGDGAESRHQRPAADADKRRAHVPCLLDHRIECRPHQLHRSGRAAHRAHGRRQQLHLPHPRLGARGRGAAAAE